MLQSARNANLIRLACNCRIEAARSAKYSGAIESVKSDALGWQSFGREYFSEASGSAELLDLCFVSFSMEKLVIHQLINAALAVAFGMAMLLTAHTFIQYRNTKMWEQRDLHLLSMKRPARDRSTAVSYVR